jgi:hypothetical protein
MIFAEYYSAECAPFHAHAEDASNDVREDEQPLHRRERLHTSSAPSAAGERGGLVVHADDTIQAHVPVRPRSKSLTYKHIIQVCQHGVLPKQVGNRSRTKMS